MTSSGATWCTGSSPGTAPGSPGSPSAAGGASTVPRATCQRTAYMRVPSSVISSSTRRSASRMSVPVCSISTRVAASTDFWATTLSARSWVSAARRRQASILPANSFSRSLNPAMSEAECSIRYQRRNGRSVASPARGTSATKKPGGLADAGLLAGSASLEDSDDPVAARADDHHVVLAGHEIEIAPVLRVEECDLARHGAQAEVARYDHAG